MYFVFFFVLFSILRIFWHKLVSLLIKIMWGKNGPFLCLSMEKWDHHAFITCKIFNSRNTVASFQVGMRSTRHGDHILPLYLIASPFQIAPQIKTSIELPISDDNLISLSAVSTRKQSGNQWEKRVLLVYFYIK